MDCPRIHEKISRWQGRSQVPKRRRYRCSIDEVLAAALEDLLPARRVFGTKSGDWASPEGFSCMAQKAAGVARVPVWLYRLSCHIDGTSQCE